jgi:nicotinate-nucleotide adenylyltransferase
MIVDMLENKELIGKHNKHHNQHQIMKTIYQQSQAHNNPNHQFEIILGSDGFQNIEKWKNSKHIIDKYNFIVYQRPGFLLEDQIKANYRFTNSPQIFLSSTHIRELIKKNKSIQFLVPDLVKENIENNGLYK